GLGPDPARRRDLAHHPAGDTHAGPRGDGHLRGGEGRPGGAARHAGFPPPPQRRRRGRRTGHRVIGESGNLVIGESGHGARVVLVDFGPPTSQRRTPMVRTLAVLFAIVVAAPGAARAQDSKSSDLAKQLAQLLDEKKLDAIAVADPQTPGSFAAAL